MSTSINGEFSEDVQRDCLINIDEELEADPDQFCIYRVPKCIRKGKQEAYTPQIVSIGPLHHGQPDLDGMEKQKEKYVKKFFKRRSCKKPDEVFAFIKNQEQKIRKCYSEPCNHSSEAYVRMILHDAIFIIELLMRGSGSDFFINTPAEMSALRLDLLLLENQLPYFLLEELYNLVIVNSQSFKELCLKFFSDYMFSSSVTKQKGFKHLTDLQRATLLENFPEEEEYYNKDNANDTRELELPCATKLQESGVKFRCAEEGHLLAVRFERGELRIPPLGVLHETDTILRNIMALEQCCYQSSLVVCAYVQLLDSLIEDKRDAQLLVDKGIICNWMGDSKALANLFNKLCIDIPFVENHYPKLYKALKDHHRNRYNRSKARLKDVYFGDIWKGTATVAAAIILLLTFIQTMYNVKQWIS